MSENKKEDSEQIAQSVAGFLDKYGMTLWGGIKSLYKKASDETVLNWRLGYEKYLDTALNRYYFAKPFLSANRPMPLNDFYVPLGVYTGSNEIIGKASIEELVLTNKFAIIMATAGSGKSMMMRHLFVDTIRNKKIHQLPVFVELRDINNTELSLFQLIKKKLTDNKFEFKDDYIEKALKAGHFAFFLDGFDEITTEKREKTIQEIQELADKYDQNYFVLSSRPDDSLNRWTLFNVWKVSPLDLELACELIDKTPEDEELKEKFIKALQSGLFNTHESFLSNPLLLSIMLITYKDSANIPNKISTFYERAYIALYERHDAQKGGYWRDKHSKLDIQQFKKVFSAFCFLSLNRSDISFSETQAFAYIDDAKKLSNIDFGTKNFLEDSLQSACLLVRDGLDITFSHRSFQEYFAASFIIQFNDSNLQGKFIERFFSSQIEFSEPNSETFNLIYEISPEIVEKLLIIPFIEKMEKETKFSGIIDFLQHKLYLKTLLDAIEFESSSSEFDFSTYVSEKNRSYIDLCFFILEKYGCFVDFKITNVMNSETAKFAGKGFLYFSDSGYEPKISERFYGNTNKPQIFNVIKISISEFVEQLSLMSLLGEGDHLYSRNAVEKIFEVKDFLTRKYKEQEIFLDGELLLKNL